MKARTRLTHPQHTGVPPPALHHLCQVLWVQYVQPRLQVGCHKVLNASLWGGVTHGHSMGGSGWDVCVRAFVGVGGWVRGGGGLEEEGAREEGGAGVRTGKEGVRKIEHVVSSSGVMSAHKMQQGAQHCGLPASLP